MEKMNHLQSKKVTSGSKPCTPDEMALEYFGFSSADCPFCHVFRPPLCWFSGSRNVLWDFGEGVPHPAFVHCVDFRLSTCPLLLSQRLSLHFWWLLLTYSQAFAPIALCAALLTYHPKPLLGCLVDTNLTNWHFLCIPGIVGDFMYSAAQLFFNAVFRKNRESLFWERTLGMFVMWR